MLELRAELETLVQRAELELKKVEAERTPPPISYALVEAINAYLRASDPHRNTTWQLAHTAVWLATGGDVDHCIAAANKAGGFDVKRSRKLDAAIARRKYPTKWGKAFAIYTIIAEGIVDFPKRRAPTKALTAMFQDSASR